MSRRVCEYAGALDRCPHLLGCQRDGRCYGDERISDTNARMGIDLGEVLADAEAEVEARELDALVAAAARGGRP